MNNPPDAPEPEPPDEAARREAAIKRRYSRPPPDAARCERCGRDALAPLPAFSVGSGQGSRPVADDFLCLRCGHVGPFALEEPR